MLLTTFVNLGATNRTIEVRTHSAQGVGRCEVCSIERFTLCVFVRLLCRRRRKIHQTPRLHRFSPANIPHALRCWRSLLASPWKFRRALRLFDLPLSVPESSLRAAVRLPKSHRPYILLQIRGGSTYLSCGVRESDWRGSRLCALLMRYCWTAHQLPQLPVSCRPMS